MPLQNLAHIASVEGHPLPPAETLSCPAGVPVFILFVAVAASCSCLCCISQTSLEALQHFVRPLGGAMYFYQSLCRHVVPDNELNEYGGISAMAFMAPGMAVHQCN